jgi:hypothetical protein
VGFFITLPKLDTLNTTSSNATTNATGEAMGKAKDVISTAANATANATGEAMTQANNLLNKASSAGSNATQTAIDQTQNILTNVTNKMSNTASNASDCAGNEPKGLMDLMFLGLKTCDVYKMSVVPFELDNPNIEQPCLCTTLKDFIRWDYNRSGKDKETFINDNQTIIGRNYSAWQMETIYPSTGIKYFEVFSINDNLGYKFWYSAPADARFDRYLDGFKNMLKSVTFTSPTPEKKPSFLNSSDTANTSSNTAVQDKSFKILSSNDFIDSIGYLHVVGEVQNNTPTNAQFVKITGTFYDSSDNVVGTDFTYTDPSDIGSGQKAPFELLLMSASIPVSQVDHYNLQASYQ